MQAADVPVALDAIVQARVAATAGSRERALIDALATRYSARTGADTDQLALSYAAAMRALANRHVDDADIAVLAAEAMMNAHAYDYWRSDGRPQAWTPQIIAWLDRAHSLAPAHPGAHHYRIHLFEDSPHPERALASAEQLGALAPIVGHLVHMPSHIFFRVGRYREAVAANNAAVQADRDYAAATDADPITRFTTCTSCGFLPCGAVKATPPCMPQINSPPRQPRCRPMTRTMAHANTFWLRPC